MLLIAVLSVAFTSCENKSEIEGKLTNEPELTVAEYNVARANSLLDEIFMFVALVEGDHGEGKPYFCGARWTMWYGTTVMPDGTRIKKNTKPVDRETGKEWAYAHIEKYVVPFFAYFERKLKDSEIVGLALFIYNVGGETTTGKDLEGREIKEASSLFEAVNAGKPAAECVNYMTRYRKSAGRLATGLLKRHWVQGAAYLGILNEKNISQLCPTKFYQTKNLGDYYEVAGKKNKPVENEDGNYTLKYDLSTVLNFFMHNIARENEKNLDCII